MEVRFAAKRENALKKKNEDEERFLTKNMKGIAADHVALRKSEPSGQEKTKARDQKRRGRGTPVNLEKCNGAVGITPL